jgi:serine/threonine protein kinase
VTEETLKRGTQLGRYEIREMLGHGGMGQVYRAWDPVLRRDVAVKVLDTPDAELLQRFAREAEAVSKLNHPNVVSILDFSISPPPYLVMTYLRGHDLSAQLKRGQLAVGGAVDIILGVCAGVHACHSQGIIHRDLKPGNVFLNETPEGDIVKVLDFGVAIIGQKLSGEITRPGHVVGTPRYFSPEQARHLEADAFSDQYAIGLLLYVALAGRHPFEANKGHDLVRAILKAEYAGPRELRPEIPAALEACILKAMSVAKERRFPSVLAFGQAILEYTSNEGKLLWEARFVSGAMVDELPKKISPVPTSIVRNPLANVTTRNESSTLDGWPEPILMEQAVSTNDPSGENSPRSIMASAVVVPMAPMQEAPVVPTTERIRSQTAIDVSQGKPDVPAFNQPRRLPNSMQGWSQSESLPCSRPSTESTPSIETIIPFWQHKRVVFTALGLIVLLGACVAWLATR